MTGAAGSLGEIVNRRFAVILLVLFCAGAGVLGYVFRQRVAAAAAFRREVALAQAEAEWARQQRVLSTEKKVPAGENFVAALEKFGLSAEEAKSAAAAAQRAFNLRQLRAGNLITVGRSVDGGLRRIEYRIDPERTLRLVPAAGGFSAEVRTLAAKTEIVVVSGQVDDSLFNAVERAGETAELAMRLAEIFGYDLDFYTDPRRGDTFRVVLEKKRYAGGQTAGYGKIFVAAYNNGGRAYQALLFHDSNGKPAYYAANGNSLQKAFLRSPLKFGARITSHFSNTRMHPILKTRRAHLGVDYGAPVGTPVQAIGSGRVLYAGRKSGEGNLVQIAHANGYETMYLHLSKMFVRAGEHVEIGKVIGLVGSTGLSTGPHLDFRFLQRGKYKNFERLGLPPADPVAKRNWPEFQTVRDRWLPLLKNPALLQASAVPSEPPPPAHSK